MAEGKRVFIPQRLNVHLAATKEHPAGRVVTFEPGWAELDDEMQEHPILSKLVGQTPGAIKRQQRLADAEREHSDAVGEARAKLDMARAKAYAEEQKEMQGLSSEYDKRAAAAADQGLQFNEPHPHPEVQRARALTGAPQYVPAASLEQKPQGPEESKKLSDNLRSENEQQKAEAGAEQGSGGPNTQTNRTKTKD